MVDDAALVARIRGEISIFDALRGPEGDCGASTKFLTINDIRVLLRLAEAGLALRATAEKPREGSGVSEIEAVLAERGANYGDFGDVAELVQELKALMREGRCWGLCGWTSVHKEALDMIQLKIARIVNGDPNYKDNWLDIIGYAQLALDYFAKQDAAWAARAASGLTSDFDGDFTDCAADLPNVAGGA